jgi:hypothetical protein
MNASRIEISKLTGPSRGGPRRPSALAVVQRLFIGTVRETVNEGLSGLAIVFISTQFELDSDGVVSGGINSDLLARQVRAQQEMSREQRMARRNEKSLQAQSVRFFKYFGTGLALIGFGGFLYYQL